MTEKFTKSLMYFFWENLVASKDKALDIALTITSNFDNNLNSNLKYRILVGELKRTNQYNFKDINLTYKLKTIIYLSKKKALNFIQLL